MQRRVLVADDDGLVRKLLSNLFKDEAGYELCAAAKNGEEAIALAKLHQPDLIILDFSMPVMNGVEAARELKKIMPNVPIILFTLFSPAATELALGEFSVDRISLQLLEDYRASRSSYDRSDHRKIRCGCGSNHDGAGAVLATRSP